MVGVLGRVLVLVRAERDRVLYGESVIADELQQDEQ